MSFISLHTKNNIKVYYYPSPSKGGYSNPYSYHYKESLTKKYQLLNSENKSTKILGVDLLINSFKADLFIVNWLESICFLRLGILQFILAELSLWIIKKRRKKIVWMFHNIHPHQGDNKLSRKIQHQLFQRANLIISHSKEATQYAQAQTCTRVLFYPHPIQNITTTDIESNIDPFDVFIWGSILPYKGIVEFISLKQIQDLQSIKIHILGNCKDKDLATKITSYCNQHIIFENRKASFDEIKAYIQKSRYVLFPYTGNCVSSSGALIDTLILGGTPIGPNVGAFKDLSEEELCLTYSNYDELISLITTHKSINEVKKRTFINNNSWDNLIQTIYDNL